VADPAPDKPHRRQSARELLRWLLLVPIAFLILFGCGQLALSDAVYPTAVDTRSKLKADYGIWPFVMLPAINSAIVADIQRDENLNLTVIVRPFWPTSNRPTATPRPTLIAQQSTATPLPPTGTPPYSTHQHQHRCQHALPRLIHLARLGPLPPRPPGRHQPKHPGQPPQIDRRAGTRPLPRSHQARHRRRPRPGYRRHLSRRPQLSH
jgi:hypothetical protein